MDVWHLPEYEDVSLPSLQRSFGGADQLILLVQDFPTGFPKLSCFLDSDDAFMIYRRFGCVFSRLLLCKQDEIGRIEANLQAMDRTDAHDGNGRYLMSHKLDEDREQTPRFWPESRKQLMEKLEKKALEYGKNLCYCLDYV